MYRIWGCGRRVATRPRQYGAVVTEGFRRNFDRAEIPTATASVNWAISRKNAMGALAKPNTSAVVAILNLNGGLVRQK